MDKEQLLLRAERCTKLAAGHVDQNASAIFIALAQYYRMLASEAGTTLKGADLLRPLPPVVYQIS
jgi:hypothetical protein